MAQSLHDSDNLWEKDSSRFFMWLSANVQAIKNPAEARFS